ERLTREYLEEVGDDEGTRDMVSQFFHSRGDKHRLTLVKVSEVKNWFKPQETPVGSKDVHVLLVHCEYHVKLEDIDDDHTFNKDLEIPTSAGPVQFKKGEKTKLLWSYVEHRGRARDKTTFKRLRVWGQPKAWVDTQICVQLSDLLREFHEQCLVLCDCLSSRWSEPSILAHWTNQQIQVPYAPACPAEGRDQAHEGRDALRLGARTQEDR
ncbi:MAG: hypothetical protein GY772_31740, partial [bacterium]|nr:hypothetical protein [bacterium]